MDHIRAFRQAFDRVGREVFDPIIRVLEEIGRSIEAVPGWRHVERVLDGFVDAIAFGLVLLWVLRYWFLLALLALFLAGLR